MDYGRLRILVIGAHQDDPEKMAGTAVKFVRAGHEVKFLCATNGQSGHETYPGYKLVQIRDEEKRRSKEVLGIADYASLDMNDGYLTTDIPSRERMMRAIREFGPDIIFTHRPCDYHPDHRNTAMLVQDCSYLLRVPNFLPTVAVMEKLPLIFYIDDTFQKPYPFKASVIVAIDDVFDKKIEALAQHESQVFDWLPWVDGVDPATIPHGAKERREWLTNRYAPASSWQAQKFAGLLTARYGEKAAEIRFCEAFEACEYGAKHSGVDYERIFPK
jgi:LmbE family N-acetylglucosaminyl deacetylase